MFEISSNSQRFKNSPFETIPDDWDVINVERFCLSISDGTHDSPKPVENGYPLITSKNLKNGRIDWENVYLISKADYRAVITRSWVEEGDILFGMIGTIGNPVILTKKEVGIATKNVGIFRFGRDIRKSQWFFRILESPFIEKQIDASLSGSTQKFVGLETLRSLLIPIPQQPLEMEKVAEILDAIDKAIALTNTHITKLKKAKAGLLHDLLTRGIDDRGELRDYTRNPELFKRSPLGIIPKDWEITTLGNVVERSGGFIQTGPFGSQLHAYEYVDLGVPVIMPQDIVHGQISTEQIGYIAPEKAQILKRHIVQINDVIFARRGELNRCAAIGERELNWFCGTGCMLARILKHEINGFWLAEIYRHQFSQKQILARAVGSTMVNLNSTLLKSLLIAKPSIEEQLAIVEKAAIQDKRICVREEYLEKLKLLKKGLMSDLLTGRVRVKI